MNRESDRGEEQDGVGRALGKGERVVWPSDGEADGELVFAAVDSGWTCGEKDMWLTR